MKLRAAVLVLCAASASMRAAEPDWFDGFRGKAFLQGDASFVARDSSAPQDAPTLFHARWVVLRYAGFTEKERRFWPWRNLLLVTMSSGAQYVLESSLGFVDESHLEEEHPWQRVASSRTAFEVWMPGYDAPPGDVPDASACAGISARVRAPGGSLDYFIEDLSSRTVRASLTDIVAATFDEDERRDLAALLRISVEGDRAIGTDMPSFNLRDPISALSAAFRDQVPSPEKRTVVLAPNPAPTTDLAPWRALAHLPLDLPPFPPLPPDTFTK